MITTKYMVRFIGGVCLALLLSPSAWATDLFVAMNNFTSAASATNVDVVVQPQQLWGGNTGSISLNSKVLYNSGSTASFWVSNIVDGIYQFDTRGVSPATRFYIIVTNQPAVVYAYTNRVVFQVPTIPASDYAWSTWASDNRYLTASALAAFGNLSYSNSASLLLSSTNAGSNYLAGSLGVDGTVSASNFVGTLPAPVTLAAGWYWIASMNVNNSVLDRNITLLYSGDGVTWTNLVGWNRLLFDPDWNTNSASTRNNVGDVSLQYASDGFFYIQYPRKSFSVDAAVDIFSSGIRIGRSSDLTNWSRVFDWYPFPTNVVSASAAGSWFTDTDGSNYLNFGWTTNQVAHSANMVNNFDCYMSRRLDGSFTNWSTPSLVLSNSQGFLYDGNMNRIGDTYYFYYVDSVSDGIGLATNNTLATPFHVKTHDVFGDGSFVETPWFFNLSSTTNLWRLFYRDSIAGIMSYADSTDMGATWATAKTQKITTNGVPRDISDAVLYGSQGIIHLTNSTRVGHRTLSVYGDVTAQKVVTTDLVFDRISSTNPPQIGHGGIQANFIQATNYYGGLAGGTNLPLSGLQQMPLTNANTMQTSTNQILMTPLIQTPTISGAATLSSGFISTGSSNFIQGQLSIANQIIATNSQKAIFGTTTATNASIDGATGNIVGAHVGNGAGLTNQVTSRIVAGSGITTSTNNPGQATETLTIAASGGASLGIVTNGGTGLNNGFTNAVVVGMTNASATASRIASYDANKILTNAAASGAVPIDADGTASTFAQVNALAPGFILTNNVNAAVTVSNNLTVDSAHKFIVTHISSAGGTPTVVTNTGGACTIGCVPTLDANAHDSAMTVNLATGTGTASPGLIFTVTFATAYATVPHVVWSHSDNVSGLLGGRPCVTNVTTGGFSFWSGSTALTTSTNYMWTFITVE